MPSISSLTNRFGLLKLKSPCNSEAKYPSPSDDNYSQREQKPQSRRHPLSPLMMSKILHRQRRALKAQKMRLKPRELRARREFMACEGAEKLQLAPPYKASRLNPEFEVLKEKLDENPTIKKWNTLRLVVRRRSKIAVEIEKKTEKLERLSKYISAIRQAQEKGVGCFNAETRSGAGKRDLARKLMETSSYLYD